MNRRGHLSSKIPNVKLRPARAGATAAAAARKKEASPMNAMDEEMLRRAWADAEDEEESTGGLRSTSRPWEGVTITFTGIDDKARLAELAKHLGARVDSALTVNTTHVVAVGFNSPKYSHAVEHRIPVLRPSWIESAHERWLEGAELTVRETMQGNELLAFSGLTIAMSGIEPLERRKQVVRHITANGGVYSKDLDRECTHLISAQPTNVRNPSEKVKWATRELATRDGARRQGKAVQGEDMRIVYEEWIWDCVGFGGRWREDWYDARKVRRTARCSAEDVLSGRVVRPTEKFVSAQEEKEAPAVLRKRKREALDGLVGEIISTTAGAGGMGRPAPRRRGNVDDSAAEMQASTSGDLDPAPEVDVDIDAIADHGAAGEGAAGKVTGGRRQVTVLGEVRKTSLLHASRTRSFAAPVEENEDEEAGHGAEAAPAEGGAGLEMADEPGASRAEVTSVSTLITGPAAGPGSASASAILGNGSGHASGSKTYPQIFAGLAFTPTMTMRTDTMAQAITKHGGRIVSLEAWEAGAHTDMMIVKLIGTVRPDLSHLPENERPQVVTEVWLEGCCFEQRLLVADAQTVFTPLPAEKALPLQGVERVLVHISGYSAERTVYMQRLLSVLGLAQSVRLNRQSTHLVCARPEGIKWTKANEWGVEAVKETWLDAMAQSGRMEGLEAHRHGLEVGTGEVQTAGPEEAGEVAPPAMGRTKGQEQEEAPVGGALTSLSATADRRLGAAPTHVDLPADVKDAQTSMNVENGGDLVVENERESVRHERSGTMEQSGSIQVGSAGGVGAEGGAPRPASQALSQSGPGSMRQSNGAEVGAGRESLAREGSLGRGGRGGKENDQGLAQSQEGKESVAAVNADKIERLSLALGRTASAPTESVASAAKKALNAELSTTTADAAMPNGAKDVSRTRSAGAAVSPINPSAAAAGNTTASTASTSGLGRSEMTEMLRLLAESDAGAAAGTSAGAGAVLSGISSPIVGVATSSPAPRTRVPNPFKRTKPTSRLRHSTASASGSGSGSGVSGPSELAGTPAGRGKRMHAGAGAGDVSVADTTATTIMFTPSPPAPAKGARSRSGSRRGTSGTPAPVEFEMDEAMRREMRAGLSGVGAGRRGDGMGEVELGRGRGRGRGGEGEGEGEGFGGFGEYAAFGGHGYGYVHGGGQQQHVEESVRVDYVDPAAERERKRVYEAFKRAERRKAAGGEVESQ